MGGMRSVGLATQCTLRERDDGDGFNGAIMHQMVCPRLFSVTVDRSAEVDDTARMFGLTEEFVRRNWITSSSPTTVTVPVEGRAKQSTGSQGLRKDRTMYSRPVNLEEVIQRLPRCVKDELPRPSVAEGSRGFGRCHKDIALSGEFCVARRQGSKGTYRCGQGAVEIGKDSNLRTYVEMKVLAQEGEGGICIGFADEQHELNRMVGSDNWSVGLFSTGEVIFRNKYFKACEGFQVGDTVGMSFSALRTGDSPVTDERSSDASTGPCNSSSQLRNEQGEQSW